MGVGVVGEVLLASILKGNTVESCDYAPPLVHASTGQKRGGDLYVGS